MADQATKRRIFQAAERKSPIISTASFSRRLIQNVRAGCSDTRSFFR